MPNPLGRRRASTGSEGSSDPTAAAEISSLKAELYELREMYAQDIANISNDMKAVFGMVTPPEPVVPNATEEVVVSPDVQTVSPEVVVVEESTPAP